MSLPTPFLKATDAMLSALLPFTIDCGCAQSRAEACFRLAATTVIITEMSVVSGEVRPGRLWLVRLVLVAGIFLGWSIVTLLLLAWPELRSFYRN
jgi:hypothetical protein